MGFLHWLLDTSNYPPRWYCGQWSSAMGWLHIVSDVAIFVAYFTIPAMMVYFLRKRRDFPMTPVLWLFALFILCCGVGHLLEACIFWYPAYHLSGLVKLMTATVSLGTAAVLVKILPIALSLPGVAKFNTQLMQEVEERKRTEAALQASLEDVATARAELEQRHIELAMTNERLQAATQAARAATQTKSEFLANMSHEIRTPMTAILGYAELLAAQLRAEGDLEAVATIRRNGEYLLELINDVLDLSKIEANRLEVERIACSPLQIVADVVSLMRVRADAKGLPLNVEYRGALPLSVLTDPTRLRQCLVNLVGNAIKFTEIGAVTILASYETSGAGKSNLRFDVIDTGLGMTAAQQERLFSPFTQGDSSTARRFGGTGLGLTITRRLAEMLGGSIELTSAPGQGSTFTLRVEAEAVAAAQSSPTPDEPEESQPPVPARLPPGCRILLAEDGPDNQRLLSALLRAAGATVELMENGRQAVDRLLDRAESGVDLVLMDMQMPVLDGYEATRRLRAAGYAGPIVALTAHAMTSDRDRCLASGCTDYATKPIDRRRLLAVVMRNLAPSPVDA
jgi:two-component system, sensor histidine kinase